MKSFFYPEPSVGRLTQKPPFAEKFSKSGGNFTLLLVSYKCNPYFIAKYAQKWEYKITELTFGSASSSIKQQTYPATRNRQACSLQRSTYVSVPASTIETCLWIRCPDGLTLEQLLLKGRLPTFTFNGDTAPATPSQRDCLPFQTPPSWPGHDLAEAWSHPAGCRSARGCSSAARRGRNPQNRSSQCCL